MPEMNMEALITRLLSDPDCAISPAKNPIAVPECVPADVREFLADAMEGGFTTITTTRHRSLDAIWDFRPSSQ